MKLYERLVTTARSPHCDQLQRHAAFAQLVTEFRTITLSYAYQVLGDEQLAQDIAQESFLTAYQRLAQLREPAAFPGWLRRIVHTQCHRVTRTRRPQNVPLELAELTHPVDGDLAQLMADEDAAQHMIDGVMSAVAELPDHERVVVRLFYLDGYSIRDVAEALDLPITTIKKRLQYARARLRKRLTERFAQVGVTIQTLMFQVGQCLLPLLTLAAPEPTPRPVLALNRRVAQ
ncbi:MAG: RNA polymerase sigma factor [Chloroflexota bacterium]